MPRIASFHALHNFEKYFSEISLLSNWKLDNRCDCLAHFYASRVSGCKPQKAFFSLYISYLKEKCFLPFLKKYE